MDKMDADWLHWVEENSARGIPPNEIIQILCQNGFEPTLSLKVVAETFLKLGLPQFVDLQAQIAQASPPQIKPVVRGEAPWEVVMSMASPRIIVYKDVMTADECDYLVEMSKPKLKISTTVNNETGAFVPHEHRTSSGTYFLPKENAFVDELDRRLAQIMQVPLENGEGLQILNYQVGGEYKPHFDYFPPELPGSAVPLKNGGQRVATMILYLNTVKSGGETIFPKLNLDVAPIKGSAVYFSYFNNNQVDPLTLHGGAPIVAGEKWIATKWVRERQFV